VAEDRACPGEQETRAVASPRVTGGVCVSARPRRQPTGQKGRHNSHRPLFHVRLAGIIMTGEASASCVQEAQEAQPGSAERPAVRIPGRLQVRALQRHLGATARKGGLRTTSQAAPSSQAWWTAGPQADVPQLRLQRPPARRSCTGLGSKVRVSTSETSIPVAGRPRRARLRSSSERWDSLAPSTSART
jgi:hypothetical protein